MQECNGSNSVSALKRSRGGPFLHSEFPPPLHHLLGCQLQKYNVALLRALGRSKPVSLNSVSLIEQFEQCLADSHNWKVAKTNFSISWDCLQCNVRNIDQKGCTESRVKKNEYRMSWCSTALKTKLFETLLSDSTHASTYICVHTYTQEVAYVPVVENIFAIYTHLCLYLSIHNTTAPTIGFVSLLCSWGAEGEACWRYYLVGI